MQKSGASVIDRQRHATDCARPGLDVSVTAVGATRPVPEVRLSARGGTAPMRVYVYVDGQLVDAHAPAEESFTVDLAGLPAGRHAVTARAIDASGRWGGASIVVTAGSAAAGAPDRGDAEDGHGAEPRDLGKDPHVDEAGRLERRGPLLGAEKAAVRTIERM